MLPLKLLSALFKSIAGLKNERKRVKWQSRNMAETITLMLRGKTGSAVKLTLPCKCCSHDHEYDVARRSIRRTICARTVLWSCAACGEVCSECRKHCATCECCGKNMYQDCISDDGELCWPCVEELEEGLDEASFECEYCGENKPVTDKIDGGDCAGKDDGRGQC